MPGKERRIAPRKDCSVPLHFRILTNEDCTPTVEIPTSQEVHMTFEYDHHGKLDGRAINLSERGIYFSAYEKLSIGLPLELYFTIPSELTGRKPEEVRCKARVVHIDELSERQGLTRVGAAVERFEPLAH
jgi:hypothetical protein